MHIRNQSIKLDLPDESHILDLVYSALMNGKVVQMADLETLNDFKLLQIGWIYDVNFSMTFQIIRDKRYLQKIRKALPMSSLRIKNIYKRANEYLMQNISAE